MGSEIQGTCSPQKVDKTNFNLDCVSEVFYGGERDYRAVKKRSKSQLLDLLQI